MHPHPQIPKTLPADGVPGLGVSQATHLVASALFDSMQASHSHVPGLGANLAKRLSAFPVGPEDDALDFDPGTRKLYSTY